MRKILRGILLGFLIIVTLIIFFIGVTYLILPRYFKSSVLVIRGAIYSAKNLEEKAIEFYKRAEQIDPDNLAVYDAISRSYARMHLNDKAMEYLKKGIERRPSYEEFYTVITSFYMSKKLHKEAEGYFRELLKKDPNNKLAAKYILVVQYGKLLDSKEERAKENTAK